VYCVILRRPASPSFLRASIDGMITVHSCMMIDAEMYGMIPSAKIEKRDSAPPENTFSNPRMPPCCPRNSSSSTDALIPGTGMCVPTR
jgi:hypothetical protein